MKKLPLITLLFPIIGLAQSPGNVSANLRLWFKADVGTTGTAPVTNWTDQSGNGLNATSGTGPNLISNSINFNPVLEFDGTSQYMQVTNGIYGGGTFNDMFVFMVSNTRTVKNSTIFWESLNGGDRFGCHQPWGDGNVYYDHGTCCGASRISTAWGGATATPYLWSFGSSTGTATPSGTRKSIYRDGLVIVTNNNNDNGTGNNSNFYLGSNTASGSHHGDIAEFIVYNGVPSAVDMHKIHSYLAIKYGLTLDQSTAQSYVSSSNTPIYNSQAAGTHDGYDNDIAGIGRDDNSGLDQRKSMSINSDAIVVMDNGAAFGTDEDFVVWGNDGVSVAPTTTQAHPSYTYRSGRVWRVDLTGTPGAVSVSFVLGGALINSGNPADYALLIDGTDTDFSAGAVAHTTGASINGDTLTFTGVNWTDGDFFTLATDNIGKYPGGVIQDMKIWLKADVGTTGTANVTAWTDNSGYNNNMSTATGPELLTPRVNFNPSLQFNGSNEAFSGSSIWNTDAVSDVNIYTLSRTNTIQANSMYREQVSGTNGRFGVHMPWTDNNVYFDAGPCCATGFRISTNWGGTTGTEYIWTFNGSTTTSPEGNRHEIMRDGSSLTSDNSFSGFTGNGSNFNVGSSGGASFFNGEIAELIIYASNLSLDEQRRIHTYLAVKYGITLAHNYLNTSSSVIWDATANAAYHNDVAGIGRDDAEDLNQKQSKSENTDAIVTGALGSVAADNASNGNSFAADQSYFIWGNDNGAIAADGVVDLPAGITSRIARVWLSEENGTVGTVRIQFDESAIMGPTGNGTNDLANTRLLVDADGVFAAGATIIAPTAFDNTANTVDFDHDFVAGTGFYFTLGSVSLANTPLPIELLSFDAEVVGNNVLTSWVAATEIDLSHYNVYKSKNAVDWELVGRVDAAGQSSSALHYSLKDENPYNGASFYRLESVDTDMSREWHNIVLVNMEDNTLEVFPNPSKDYISVNYTEGISNIDIMNSTGQIVQAPVVSNANSAQVDVRHLAEGYYFLRVTNVDGSVNVRQIVVSR